MTFYGDFGLSYPSDSLLKDITSFMLFLCQRYAHMTGAQGKHVNFMVHHGNSSMTDVIDLVCDMLSCDCCRVIIDDSAVRFVRCKLFVRIWACCYKSGRYQVFGKGEKVNVEYSSGYMYSSDRHPIVNNGQVTITNALLRCTQVQT